MSGRSTETRHHVTYLYPGFFFPEDGKRCQIGEPTVEQVQANSPDDQWFAAEVSTQQYTRWTDGGGGEKWLPTEGSTRSKFRVLVGETLTAEDVAALDGDHSILLSNMRSNRWDRVCRTRRGNFQPVDANDVVIEATREVR
jgi:hypothetical protein